MAKLFVSGFPLDMDELSLAELFGPFGDISTVKIVRDKKTRVCKGYGFIEMVERVCAANAANALNGTFYGTRELTVTINRETPAPPANEKIEKFNGPRKPKRPRIA